MTVMRTDRRRCPERFPSVRVPRQPGLPSVPPRSAFLQAPGPALSSSFPLLVSLFPSWSFFFFGAARFYFPFFRDPRSCLSPFSLGVVFFGLRPAGFRFLLFFFPCCSASSTAVMFSNTRPLPCPAWPELTRQGWRCALSFLFRLGKLREPPSYRLSFFAFSWGPFWRPNSPTPPPTPHPHNPHPPPPPPVLVPKKGGHGGVRKTIFQPPFPSPRSLTCFPVGILLGFDHTLSLFKLTG